MIKKGKKRKRDHDYSDLKEKSCSDPAWLEVADLLLPVMKKPVTWVVLDEWAKSNNIGGFTLRNMVAWLEIKKLIMSEKKDNVIMWKLRKI